VEGIHKLNKPSQKFPFPLKPELHEQANDPSVLLQEEFEWQLLLPCGAHSSISVRSIIKSNEFFAKNEYKTNFKKNSPQLVFLYCTLCIGTN
jgi:hypothetical protein